VQKLRQEVNSVVKRGCKPEVILVSPLTRTLQTATGGFLDQVKTCHIKRLAYQVFTNSSIIFSEVKDNSNLIAVIFNFYISTIM
jgi:phosphohistidine phosphatase SixA